MKNISAVWRSPYGVAAEATVGLLGAGVAVDQLTAGPRQVAAAVCGVSAVGWLFVAAVHTPWRRPPASRADLAAVLDDLPAEPIARSRRLHAELRPVGVVGLTVTLAIIVGLGLTPAGARLVTWASQPVGGFWVAQVLVGVVTLVAIPAVALLPAAAYKHVVLVRHGLSTLRWRDWAAALVGRHLVVCVFASIPALVFVSVARLSPHWWWAWVAATLGVLTLVQRLIVPAMRQPAAGTGQPLHDTPVRDRLLALAARDGLPVRDVLIGKPMRNAAVRGLGRHRRILLSAALFPRSDAEASTPRRPDDVEQALSATLLRGGATDDQIVAIVARELSHAKHHKTVVDTVILTLQSTVIVSALYLLDGWQPLLDAAGVDSIAAPNAVALFVVLVLALASIRRPADAFISRRFESHADWHALHLTGDPIAVESVCRRIIEVNLPVVRPNRFTHLLLGTEPSLVQRIATARAYARHQAIRHPQPQREPST